MDQVITVVCIVLAGAAGFTFGGLFTLWTMLDVIGAAQGRKSKRG